MIFPEAVTLAGGAGGLKIACGWKVQLVIDPGWLNIGTDVATACPGWLIMGGEFQSLVQVG